ncbi:uncharacterized protein LOC141905907 [Tubulanus polymorphus]|uniref:uncharacterized protein LOC141905907 n=1 Tax=Tubulanus polymorphus TaxID=672921 RepID=UPI003DA20CC3
MRLWILSISFLGLAACVLGETVEDAAIDELGELLDEMGRSIAQEKQETEEQEELSEVDRLVRRKHGGCKYGGSCDKYGMSYGCRIDSGAIKNCWRQCGENSKTRCWITVKKEMKKSGTYMDKWIPKMGSYKVRCKSDSDCNGAQGMDYKKICWKKVVGFWWGSKSVPDCRA